MAGPIKRRQALHQQLRDNEERLANLQQQILATQKLATLGTMAALAAHEFNNILVPMINYAELALKHQDDLDLMRKALEKTIKHGNRAAAVIHSMLGLVRDQSSEREEVRLRAAVEDAFQCLARDFGKDKISVCVDVPPDLAVHMVPGQLQQVLLNLIINARQAMLGRGGTLTLTTQPAGERGAWPSDGAGLEAPDERQGGAAEPPTPGMVTLSITDSGCGIEPDLLERIFEPFFSTKTDADQPDQMGTGLGLTICRDIIESHGGTIAVASALGQGTAFTLTLPAA